MAFSTIVLPQIMNSTMSNKNNSVDHVATDVMNVDKDQATWIGKVADFEQSLKFFFS